MKNSILLFVFFSISSFSTFAQKGPLRGSGVIVSKSFSLKDFDKISFEDFDDQIEVEIGKLFSIRIDIDDNLAERLFVKKTDDGEYQLKIGLKDNLNGKLYLENTHIKIKVTMPEASVIEHRGNSNLKISGIIGRYFRLKHQGNGGVILQGSIDNLDIDKLGNGNIHAETLEAKMAKVKNFGNGNVYLKVSVSLRANGAGNGSVFKSGTGRIEPLSGIVGNGSVQAN